MSKPNNKPNKTLHDLFEEDLKNWKRATVKAKSLSVPVTLEKPAFNISTVNTLYDFGYDLPFETIEELLSLPHKELCEDLNSVIYDACTRLKNFKSLDDDKSTWVLLHACLLARELKAEECLDPILDALSQHEEFLEFFLSDALTEIMWSVIAACGINKLERLSVFMKEHGRYLYSKTTVSTAVVQLALNGIIERDRAVTWLKDVMEFHLENREVETLADSELNGFLIGDCLDLNARELLPIVKRMYEEHIVAFGISGDWEEVQEEINEPAPSDWKKREFETVYQTYEDYRQVKAKNYYDVDDLFLNDDLLSDNDDFPDNFFISQQPYVREDPKIGRNDVCPCGSGKKFKKCHGVQA